MISIGKGRIICVYFLLDNNYFVYVFIYLVDENCLEVLFC